MMIMKASRQPGIEATRIRHRSGFSLIEVLIGVFILGIGIISITSLFPAGIAQQQRSVDDVLGPLVAENALTILRSKLAQNDFGTDEEFNVLNFQRSLIGDWAWRRPAFFLQGLTLSVNISGTNYDTFAAPGTISIFSTFSQTTDTDETRIPWSKAKHGNNAPNIFIKQAERYYPQQPGRQKPQFVWDCMFRRYQGRVLVAIFVYRVSSPAGGSVSYNVSENPFDLGMPPIPIHLSFNNADAWNAGMGANIDLTDPADLRIIPNTGAGAVYDTRDDSKFWEQSWQLPRQIILDRNNNIHRVLVGREHVDDGPLELTRAVGPVLGNVFDSNTSGTFTESPNFFYGSPLNEVNPITGVIEPGMVQIGVVTDIWYLPEFMEVDSDGDGIAEATYKITPVFVTVREL